MNGDASQFGPLATHYDELMQVVPYDDWAEYVMTLFSFAGHKPQRTLDCACGTGNISFELARLGQEVVGVDISAEMIRVAREKAQGRNADNPRFYQADLADFTLVESFDSATCLYDSLNYILEPEGLQAAFSHIAQHVESGGVFVFDMNSVFALSQDLFTQSNFNPRAALHYDWRAHFDASTRICRVEMKFERATKNGVEEFHETHRERAYELDEVKSMLQIANWNLLYAFDAYTLNPPHARSERWFFVAQKRGD